MHAGTLSLHAQNVLAQLGDEMPEMLVPIEWEQVKSYLLAQSVRLGKKLL